MFLHTHFLKKRNNSETRADLCQVVQRQTGQIKLAVYATFNKSQFLLLFRVWPPEMEPTVLK